jgi:cytochrome c5
MTRKISLFALTSVIAASLQFSVTANADNHEIADRVRPAGILVIKEAAATPAATADTQSDTPGGDVASAVPVADAGKATYDTACFACHSTGVAGSPILGNKDAWGPRIAKGIDALYANAINGTDKGMPPKGGTTLSDDEIKVVVDYMVAQSQ